MRQSGFRRTEAISLIAAPRGVTLRNGICLPVLVRVHEGQKLSWS